MKQRLLLTTILCAALAVPAVAANVPEGTKLSDNQTFNYRVLDAIKTLDPGLNEDVDGQDAIRSLFEGLYSEDEKGNLIPAVALSHDVSDDKLTYTFHLRPEAKWANGDPVTANDFVYAWQRVADPATASNYSWFIELAQIENASDVIAGKKPPTDLGVKAVDDLTLEVKLINPIPYFPKMLSNVTMFPVPKAVIEKFGTDWTKPENIMGNGAYLLKENIPGEKLVFERNKAYWDDAHTVINTVNLLTINDENAGLVRFQAGEVDLTDVPSGQFLRLQAEDPAETISTPRACSYGYEFNLTPKGNPALQDVNVRKALNLAIDRDVIVKNILQAGQKSAYSWPHWAINGFVTPENEISKMTQEERNAKAVELMTAAGYGPDKPLTIQLNYNTDEGHKKIAMAIAQMWRQTLGVDLVLNNMEWEVHLDRLHSGDFELARHAWCADYNEASTFLDLFASYSDQNDPKFNSPEYDQLMKDSKTQADPSETYQKAEAILEDQLPTMPIYHYSHDILLKKDIKGYPLENVMQAWYVKDLYRVAE